MLSTSRANKTKKKQKKKPLKHASSDELPDVEPHGKPEVSGDSTIGEIQVQITQDVPVVTIVEQQLPSSMPVVSDVIPQEKAEDTDSVLENVATTTEQKSKKSKTTRSEIVDLPLPESAVEVCD